MSLWNMVYLIPIVVDMAVIFNEKSNHNVKLNWRRQ